ncbi:MAG: hypothetical protein KJO81_06720 [Gammaproteobacteria bacterium]|nr:hypothetical protein [Gammaproteobacteria bacterium]
MVTLNSRTLVAAYLLLALVSSQFLLVLHNIEHFDVNSHDDGSEICEVCAIAKNLGQKFLVQSHLSFSVSKSNQISVDVFKYTARSTCNKPFQSQAPPTLFS